MTLPEQRVQPEMRLTIETRRALKHAEIIASEKNSNIGLKAFFSGVFYEMGPVHMTAVLAKNGIDRNQFTNNLQLAIKIENVNKPDASAKPCLTAHARTAVIYAAESARSKKTQELLPSDLLLGIARVAEVAKADLLNQ